MTYLTSALVDRKKTDIRLEAAMAKMFGTEAAWDVVDEAMQIRGGRGYETAESLAARGEKPDCHGASAAATARINRIFEGSTEIMQLFIAREALDPHLRIAGDADEHEAAARQSASPRPSARRAFYATWYPKQWLPHVRRRRARPRPRPTRALRAPAERSASRGGCSTPWCASGRSSSASRCSSPASSTSAPRSLPRPRAPRGHTHSSRADHPREEVVALVDHFCEESRRRIDRAFQGVTDNSDRAGYKLAQSILGGEAAWILDGVVDPFARQEAEPTSAGEERSDFVPVERGAAG